MYRVAFLMSFPEKLLERTFYWSPLLVGVVSLIIGVILVETVDKHDGDVQLAHLKFQEDALEAKTHPVELAGKSPLKTIAKRKEDKQVLATLPPQLNLKDKPLKVEKPRENNRVADTVKNSKDVVEHTVRITVPQMVKLQSSTLSKGVPSVLAGLRATAFGSSKIGFSHRGSNLSYWGKLSHLGFETSLHRTLHVTLMERGETLGTQSQLFIDGFDHLTSRAELTLAQYLAENLGGHSATAYLGFSDNRNSSQLVVNEFFETYGAELGKISPVTLTGFDTSLFGSETLLKGYKIAELSKEIGRQISHKNIDGVNYSLTSAEKLKMAALALSAHKAKVEDKSQNSDLSELSCSERYYAALKEVRSSKISDIRNVARPLSQIDKTLPGKWIFRPPNFKARSVCRKYKYYKSGRKKCLKWRKQVAENSNYTEDEKSFILAAQKIISGKGRHPLVKPRSPSHWVINIVAQNLNSYSSQKSHPAICTGALGMVDYFEGNLTRLKKHIMQIATLHEQSKVHILNHVERFNVTLEQTDALGYADQETASVTQYNKIKLSSYDPQTVNGQAVASLFGEDVGLEILSRHNFIQALKLTKTVLKSRKEQLDPDTYTAFQRLTTLLEARYYIQQTHQKYQDLEVKLFGSLRDIRTAHSTHCNCSN